MRARLGEFDGAFEGANAWRHHIHELGQEIMYAGTASCVWDVCSWARDWVHGEDMLRESYEMFERMGLNAHRSTIAAHLGRPCSTRVVSTKRRASASRASSSARGTTSTTTCRGGSAPRLRRLTATSTGSSAREDAVEVAVGMGFLDEVAVAWLDLAGNPASAGDPEARTAATEALGLFERKGNLVGARWARELLDQTRSDP